MARWKWLEKRQQESFCVELFWNFWEFVHFLSKNRRWLRFSVKDEGEFGFRWPRKPSPRNLVTNLRTKSGHIWKETWTLNKKSLNLTKVFFIVYKTALQFKIWKNLGHEKYLILHRLLQNYFIIKKCIWSRN